MIRLGLALSVVGIVANADKACGLQDVISLQSSTDNSLSQIMSSCAGLTDATALRSCLGTNAERLNNNCARCVVTALTPGDISCVISCSSSGANCATCAIGVVQKILTGCFPQDVVDMLLPLINSSLTTLTGGPAASACLLTDAQLKTIPTDLMDCMAATETSVCMSARGYSFSGECGTCIFSSASIASTCPCTDPTSKDCRMCASQQAMSVLSMCVPQWDPRFSVPGTQEQCSIEDLMTIPSEADLTTLVSCVAAGTDSSACWPTGMAKTCSDCLATVFGAVPDTCDAGCMENMAKSVIGRCLGIVAPPHVAACSKTDRDKSSVEVVNSAVLQCAVLADGVVDATELCLSSSSINSLSSSCISCLARSPVWSASSSGCSASCSTDSNGNISCSGGCDPATSLPPQADSVDTRFCFDPNGMEFGNSVGMPSVCSMEELVSLGTSVSDTDVNDCLAEPDSVEAYKCMSDIIGNKTPCEQCVSATMSVVAGCAMTCKSSPTSKACGDCVSGAMSSAAGVCTSQGMPKYASDLLAKASSAISQSIIFAIIAILVMH